VDLKDFFPSITFRRVRGLFEAKPYQLDHSVATVLARICCHKNSLPQGAPTSPIISNMICARMDSQLRQLAVRHRCAYTRYADDLTFSTSTRNFPEALAEIVSTETGNKLKIGVENNHKIKLNGFEINQQKTRLQTSDKRQVVTGLTVNRFPKRKGLTHTFRKKHESYAR
jgi:RNA-directed DNA polymerase